MKKIDRKILFELDRNSRQSYSEIAKSIKTSKQVVGNHIQALRINGVKKFLTVLDLSQVDLIVHKVYVRLVRASLEDEMKFLEYLECHKNVAWLARTEGIYDFAYALHTSNVIDLNCLLGEMENKFGNFILEKVVNRVVGGEFLHRAYFLEDKKHRKNLHFQSEKSLTNLDDTAFSILASLSKDARVTAVEIAKHIPITADAVGKRIKNLERLGVICGYTVVPDNSALDQIHYKVLLKITNFNQRTEKKFIEFCAQHKYITFYNKNIGSWELEIDIEVSTPDCFREIMREIKQEFAESIREYFSLIVYDIMKFDFLPMYGVKKKAPARTFSTYI